MIFKNHLQKVVIFMFNVDEILSEFRETFQKVENLGEVQHCLPEIADIS